LERFCNKLYNFFSWINALLLSSIIILVFIQVLNRFIFKLSLPWIQEISLLCFYWAVFIGAALAVRKRSHFSINIWPVENNKIQSILNIFAMIVILIVSLLLFIQGYKMAINGIGRFTRQLGISKIFFLAPVPFSGLLMVIFITENFIKQKYKDIKEEVDTL